MDITFPDDTSLRLFTFLNAPALSNISITCKRFYILAQQRWLKLASPYFSQPADLKHMSWKALKMRMAKAEQFPQHVTRTTIATAELRTKPLKLGGAVAFKAYDSVVKLWQPGQKEKDATKIKTEDEIIAWSALPQRDGSFQLALLTSQQPYNPLTKRIEGQKLQLWSTSGQLVERKLFESQASQLTCLHPLESPFHWLATIFNGNELSIFDLAEKHAYQFGKLAGSVQYDYLEGKDAYLIADSYGDSVRQRTVFQCSQSAPPQQLWQVKARKSHMENCICQLDDQLVTVALTPDNKAKAFDLKTGAVLRSIDLEEGEGGITIVSGKWARLIKNDDSMRLWNLETEELLSFGSWNTEAVFPNSPSCFVQSGTAYNTENPHKKFLTTTLECIRLINGQESRTVLHTDAPQPTFSAKPIASLSPGIVAIGLKYSDCDSVVEIFDFLSDQSTT
jgi:WD40 repeat protein